MTPTTPRPTRLKALNRTDLPPSSWLISTMVLGTRLLSMVTCLSSSTGIRSENSLFF
uniref:Uncharacterized protein n=1 Tax=Siphoviridae sp. ctxMM9 TaxID=2827973 RepID=A0A8S5T655_9CAUD|nr:MAG TPA: hypothetical protein [Siphoviridae sp. ctxMM9]